jgi:hypothetical protein
LVSEEKDHLGCVCVVFYEEQIYDFFSARLNNLRKINFIWLIIRYLHKAIKIPMYIKPYILILGAILAFFSTNSCSSTGDAVADSGTINMHINHYKQTGFGPFPMLAYLVQEGKEMEGNIWKYFYDEIEGFEFEPGYLYELEVKTEKVENPPQDASSVKYILQNVISKTRVPLEEIFEIRLKWNDQNFVEISEGRFSLMKEFEIDCGDLCEELSQRLESSEDVTGVFKHGANNDLKLISLQ